MISHEYKCIFVHIPRTAGSSIENWLIGCDWWDIKPETKHLTASQTKEEYREYWDDYFKFSIVRDPVTRCKSLLKYDDLYQVFSDGAGGLDFAGYLNLFGYPVTVEHDHRFHELSTVRKEHHKTGSVYGNILDEKLDYIGKYEQLDDVVQRLTKELGVKHAFDVHVGKTNFSAMELSSETLETIKRIYRQDFVDFDYKRPRTPWHHSLRSIVRSRRSFPRS